MRFLISTILLSLTLSISLSQENDVEDLEKPQVDKKFTAIKLAPSLFWNTIGVDIEKQITKRMTLGISVTVTYGRPLDNDAVVQATQPNTSILSEGISIDLVGKKYVSPSFEKLFFFASVSYNTIEYFNVDKRPFTLFNMISERKKQEILETNDRVTDVYGVSIGTGYQMVIIPRHLILNIEGGLSGYMTVTKLPFLTLYITPSIGYKF